jgi:flagella basal body P-ring formation protein FlgA
MNNLTRAWTCLVLIAASSFAACPATVRLSYYDSCIVNDTVVRLGDIARIESNGPDSAMERLSLIAIGESAPAGFSRYVNTSEGVSLAVHARFPDLRILSLSNKRILVKTGFEEKTVDEFREVIDRYVMGKVLWPSGTCSLLIKNGTEKWKCLRRPLLVRAEGLASKYQKGNFSLKLIGEQGSRHYSIHVSCFMRVIGPVVVAKMDIMRGMILKPENFSLESQDITQCSFLPLSSLREIENCRSSRAIPMGSIIHEALLYKMPIIERDDPVTVSVTHGRVTICMSARAREAGSMGDKIWVENEMTHKLLKTKVIDRGKVSLLTAEGTL